MPLEVGQVGRSAVRPVPYLLMATGRWPRRQRLRSTAEGVDAALGLDDRQAGGSQGPGRATTRRH